MQTHIDTSYEPKIWTYFLSGVFKILSMADFFEITGDYSKLA